MQNIKLFMNGLPVSIEFMTFSGGEEQVKILTATGPRGSIGRVYITAYIKSSQDVMRLVMLNDAVRRLNRMDKNCKYVLDMPYVPYARQDRVMQPGEALSVKVFAGIINLMGFDQVIVDDPHSDVTTAVIDNVTVRTQDEIAATFSEHLTGRNVVVVAPDAGARKKAQKFAERFRLPIVEAGKVRDVSNGKITGTTVFGDVTGKDCVIIDDIADGAYTFLKLGEVLKENGAAGVVLYVTHGIFSKGVDILHGAVDEVYTAHPWYENIDGRNEHGLFKKTR